MAGADFRSLLARNVGEIEKPKPFPIGTYGAIITAYEPVESSKKKTHGIRFTFQFQSAGADVDTDQLEEAGGLAALVKRKISTTYWITEDSEWRLREFLESHCGLSVDGRSLGEVLPDTQNIQVLLRIEHEVTDKQEVRMQIAQVLNANEAEE